MENKTNAELGKEGDSIKKNQASRMKQYYTELESQKKIDSEVKKQIFN